MHSTCHPTASILDSFSQFRDLDAARKMPPLHVFRQRTSAFCRYEPLDLREIAPGLSIASRIANRKGVLLVTGQQTIFVSRDSQHNGQVTDDRRRRVRRVVDVRPSRNSIERSRVGLGFFLRSIGFLNPVLLHAVHQRLAADIQILCRMRLIPMKFFECPQNQLLLNRFETDPAGR